MLQHRNLSVASRFTSQIGFDNMVPNMGTNIMHLSGKLLLADFVRLRPDVAAYIAAWRNEVEDATWRSFEDVRLRYLSARWEAKLGQVIFELVPDICVVSTTVNYEKESVLVTQAGSRVNRSRKIFRHN